MTATRSELHAAAAARRGGVPLVAVSVPLVVGAALASHPPDPTMAAELAPVVGRWLTVHLVLLAGLPMLALVIQALLRDVSGRFAVAGRWLVVPGAALYAAFDALLGIGTGVLVAASANLPVVHREGAAELTQLWWQVPTVVSVIATFAIATWTAALACAGIALHRVSGRRLAGWALVVGACSFALGHPGATGAAAMVAVAVAVVAARPGVRSRGASSSAATARDANGSQAPEREGGR